MHSIVTYTNESRIHQHTDRGGSAGTRNLDDKEDVFKLQGKETKSLCNQSLDILIADSEAVQGPQWEMAKMEE